MPPWEAYLQERSSQYLMELTEFLRIPSISSLPEHNADVKRAAEWVAARLKTAGIEKIRILPTGGHPVVYGEWLHASDKPTIMIYGHFDTQPVDPIGLWRQPPFEPVIDKDRIYARGASDDKGNMLIPILAAEAMLRSQETLPVNLKFCFEGQEEIGSPQLPDFIASRQNLLACDLVLSADGGQWAEDQPALQIGLRGICALQLDLRSAKHDVHSGTYGGTFLNPIHALAGLIESMHSPEGKVLVKGFYDDVRSLSSKEQARIAEIPYKESDYKAELGVSALFGEPGYTTYERAWIRPTLEVNGIWGGFQDEGIKTVIPSQAHAKISCRLVPDQQPEKIIELITTHVNKQALPGIELSVRPLSSRAEPYVMPPDHPGNQAAQKVLRALFGKEPYFARMGGSIPICGLLLKHLNAYTVNFAFGLKDENVHAPNEFFRLASFERGQKAYCMILEELSRLETTKSL
ncbi:MAG: dipeptidase [Desulfobacterales bacterium]|jgi:acetylornithine deacetylase/succinyl-diaminopimelate desuccinylase-like protein